MTGFNGNRRVPPPVNEPVKSYAPGSPERAALKERLRSMSGEQIDIPNIIGGKEVHTGELAESVMPHNHRHVLAHWHRASAATIDQAITAAKEAAKDWANWAWEDRAAVFLKAAELLATTWRPTVNAATMLGQSKTAYQAEIDAACELIDFWRFNPHYAQSLYDEQPLSDRTMWNQLDYRPLEGFVYAVTPFNFTSIAGNLPTAPALMGNTVIWKPASSAMLSAYYIMKLLEEAGLPPGVINFVPGDAALISDRLLSSRDLAGVHFTGSTAVFNNMWKTIGASMSRYKSYPRIVGETGGKDFIVAHASADPVALSVAIARGGFEYQGQKCSAASRVYIPESMWPEVRDRTVAIMKELRMGDVTDFRNFMGAVIDKKAFTKIGEYLDHGRKNATIVSGGVARGEDGYFIEPTLIETKDPGYRLLCEEILARSSRRTSTPTTGGKRHSRSWTRLRPMRSPARYSAETARRSARRRSCSAMPPAISTSTTSRRAPSWGSSRSGARAGRARTIRPGRSSISCGGSVRGTSKRLSRRRQIIATRSWTPNSCEHAGK